MTSLLRRLHVARARTVLEDIARGSKPADQVLDALYRQHKEMGKRDRAAVSGMVYGVLRDVGRLQALAGDDPAGWLARHLADAGHSADTLAALDLPAPAAEAALPDHARANLPPHWWAALVAELGEAEARTTAAALREPAPTTVRVNTLKTTRDAALAALAAEGVAATPCTLAAHGIQLAQRLSKHAPLLVSGAIEPQDEGSQLLAQLADARPGQLVIDWCAGAGGKSLALAAAMHNRGRILACDITASRLAKIGPRAERAGVSIVTTHRLTADGPAPAEGALADVVLVDAPCSGTGTLRRSPELRLRASDFAALAALQGQILRDAAQQVRPGGRLIYATCSLLRQENEAVVEAFLATHPHFAPAAAPSAFPAGLCTPDGRLRLWPHRQGTDGFFAAPLECRA